MGHLYLHVNVFHPLAWLVGQSEWLSVCITEREAAVTDCDIQSSSQASPFAFIRLFDSHVGSVGKRRQKTGKGVFVCVCWCDIQSLDPSMYSQSHCSVAWFALNMRIIPHPPTSSLSQGSLNLVTSILPWRHSDGQLQGFFLAQTSVPHTCAGTHTHTSHVVSVGTCSNAYPRNGGVFELDSCRTSQGLAVCQTFVSLFHQIKHGPLGFWAWLAGFPLVTYQFGEEMGEFVSEWMRTKIIKLFTSPTGGMCI